MPDGDQFLYVLPIRNYKSLEAEFITKDVSQNVMIDVTGNAIDFRGVDHDCARAGFNRGGKGREKIFAQIIFGNPGRRSIAAVKRETVAHVVFQAGSHVVLRSDIRSFHAAHESHAHYFGKIRIFTERFIESRPNRLAPDIKDG